MLTWVNYYYYYYFHHKFRAKRKIFYMHMMKYNQNVSSSFSSDKIILHKILLRMTSQAKKYRYTTVFLEKIKAMCQ